MAKKRKFTASDRSLVIRMLDQGHSHKTICSALRCTIPTLKKYFGEILKAHRYGNMDMLFTAEHRGYVEAMIGFGLTQEQIGSVFGISLQQVSSYFSEEILRAKPIMIANVAGALYRAAMAGDTSAMRYYLGSQGGWSTHIKVGVTGEVKHLHEIEAERQAGIRESLGKLGEAGRAHIAKALEELGAHSEIDNSGPQDGDPIH